MINAETAGKLTPYLNALRALVRSTERSLREGLTDGTGALAVRGYTGLHAKIAEVLADDFFVTESLRLEVPSAGADADSGDTDRRQLSQVHMLANQLLIYLEGQIKQGGGRGAWSWGFQGDEHGAFGMPHPPEPPIPPVPPVPPNAADWRGLGRDLQEQIISMTRNTLKRALSNIDVEMSGRGTVRGADMRGEDLQRRNFAKGKLIGVNFSGANGESVNFEDAFLADVGLSDSNLTAANFSGARLERCRLDNAVLERANLGTAVLAKCDLSNANLTGANLQGTRLINPVLTGTILPDGSVWADGSDLRKFGATIVTRRIHIEIDSDDDDRQPDGDKLV